jgi:hypothetical protein
MPWHQARGIFQLHHNPMGQLSQMKSIIEQNVINSTWVYLSQSWLDNHKVSRRWSWENTHCSHSGPHPHQSCLPVPCSFIAWFLPDYALGPISYTICGTLSNCYWAVNSLTKFISMFYVLGTALCPHTRDFILSKVRVGGDCGCHFISKKMRTHRKSQTTTVKQFGPVQLPLYFMAGIQAPKTRGAHLFLQTSVNLDMANSVLPQVNSHAWHFSETHQEREHSGMALASWVYSLSPHGIGQPIQCTKGQMVHST